jgi:hypothetical protein
MKLHARADSPLRCSLCHTSIARAAGKTCSGCGTRLHTSCADEVLRCPTLGCRESAHLRFETSLPAAIVWWYSLRPVAPIACWFLAWFLASRVLCWLLGPPLWQSLVLTGTLVPGAVSVVRFRRDVYS